MQRISYKLLVFIILIVPLWAQRNFAPACADAGAICLAPGENLVLAFSVYAKVTRIEGGADVPLRILSQKLPEYPSEALNAGVVGDVKIRVDIDSEGKATKAMVEQSSAKSFSSACINAIKTWRFSLPSVSGKPSSIRLHVTIFFIRYFE